MLEGDSKAVLAFITQQQSQYKCAIPQEKERAKCSTNSTSHGDTQWNWNLLVLHVTGACATWRVKLQWLPIFQPTWCHLKEKKLWMKEELSTKMNMSNFCGDNIALCLICKEGNRFSEISFWKLNAKTWARLNVYQGKFDKDKTMEVRSLSPQESFAVVFKLLLKWI